MKRPTVYGTLAVLAAALALPSAAADAPTDLVAVVSSKAADSYHRSHAAGGSYAPEYYSFADGGHWTGTVRDGSIDRLTFLDVARTIAQPLAQQNYIPTRDPKQANLLLVVYYGRTRTPESSGDSSVAKQQLQDSQSGVDSTKGQNSHQFYADQKIAPVSGGFNYPCVHFDTSTASDFISSQDQAGNALAVSAATQAARDKEDVLNASLLGYEEALGAAGDVSGGPLEERRKDLVDEVEHDRYFVIIMAYDFQRMWREKKHVLVWETRYSIRQRGIEFDQQLLAMTKSASPYFGRDSDGLIRTDLPAGRVDIGSIKDLGTVAQK